MAKTEEEKQHLLQEGQAEAKTAFEAKKQAILSILPNSYQDKFGSVGFVKWTDIDYDEHLPVVVLSPFDVEPGVVRNLWIQSFQMLRDSGKSLDTSMPFLVNWLGADLEEGYSLVSQTQFVPHDKASQEMLECDKLAKQKQQSSKVKLHDKDLYRLKSMAKLHEELQKDPKDRRGEGPREFKEQWQLLTLADVDEISCSTMDLSDEEEEDDETDSQKQESLSVGEESPDKAPTPDRKRQKVE